MSINKIWQLDDEALLDLLNKNGYKNIAEILNGRDINGQKFLELSEYQTRFWKLSPLQKNQVFRFIEEIKENPSIILKGPNLTTNSQSRTQTNQFVYANKDDFRKLLDLTLSPNNNSPPVRSKRSIPSPTTQKEFPIQSDQQCQNKINHPVSSPNKFKPLPSEGTLPRYNRPEVAPGEPNKNSPPVKLKRSIPSPTTQNELHIESDQQCQYKRNHPVSSPNIFKPLPSEGTLLRYNRPEVAPGDPNNNSPPVRSKRSIPSPTTQKELPNESYQQCQIKRNHLVSSPNKFKPFPSEGTFLRYNRPEVAPGHPNNNNNSPPVRSKRSIPSPTTQKELPIESDQQCQNKRNHPVSSPNKFKPLPSDGTLPRYNRPEVATGDPKSTPTNTTSRHPRANVMSPTVDHGNEGSQKFTRSRARRLPPPQPDETYINMVNMSSIQDSHSYSHDLNRNLCEIYEPIEVKRVDSISYVPSPDARYLTKRIQNPNDEYEYTYDVSPNEENNIYLNVPVAKTETKKMSSSLDNLLKLPINIDIPDEDKLKNFPKPTISLGNFRAISPNISRKEINLNKECEKYLAKERPPLPLPPTNKSKSLESVREKNHNVDGLNKNYDAVLEKCVTKSNGYLVFLENNAQRTKLTPSPTSETKRIVDDSTTKIDTEEISKSNFLKRIKSLVSNKKYYENYVPDIKKEILQKEIENEIKVLYKDRPLPDVPINSKVNANSPPKPESYCDFRKEKFKTTATYDIPQQEYEEERIYKNINRTSNDNISNHYSEDIPSQSPISQFNDLARKLSDGLKMWKLNDDNCPDYINLRNDSTHDHRYDDETDETDYSDDNEIVDSPTSRYQNFYDEIDGEKFYRNTTREGAKLLLQNLPDGAFLFRPSKHYFLALTLKFKGKCYNLGIERTLEDQLRLNADMSSVSPSFDTLGALVNHFTKEAVSFRNGGDAVEIHLNPVLPDHLI